MTTVHQGRHARSLRKMVALVQTALAHLITIGAYADIRAVRAGRTSLYGNKVASSKNYAKHRFLLHWVDKNLLYLRLGKQKLGPDTLEARLMY